MLISPDILQVYTQRFQEGSCCDGGIHHSRLHITVHWASGPNVFFFFFCLSPLLVSTSFSFFLSSFYQNASKIQLFNDNLIFWNSGKFIILNLFSQKKKKIHGLLIVSWIFEVNLCFLSHILSCLMKLSSKIIDGARKTLPTCLGFSLQGDRKGYKWKKSDYGQNWFMITLIYLLIQQYMHACSTTTAAAKSPQLCPTLHDHIDGSPPGSPVPGILQARTLEWVAISFSNAWKWKVKVKSLSHIQLFPTPWTAAYQAPLPMGFSRQEYWSGLPLPSLHACSVVSNSLWPCGL